ncbi:YolD-like family protein [Saccharibacillus alkalitolerans]|uniref:YolD-like family protein n=1 Tax=Saccharibacillus alkalitolerans TaxID=2705290 RepID=UPI001F161D15|nr:YolD-like family protein [Saccharibacillus alkalitolerans]
MTKKLEGNGLWESSRMILPEYRERIARASAERTRQRKIVLHEDEREAVFEAVKRSLALGIAVRLEVQGDRGSEWAEGVIIDASPIRGSLKLEGEFGVRRIAYSDIVGAELSES